MSTAQTALPSKEIYGGFWIRLGAICIDILIFMPLLGPLVLLDGLSKTTYYSLDGLGFVLGLFSTFYCVKKWGGTPGKLALGLKIVMENGEDVDWAAVLWRPSVIY